ncbi:hypothetical protein [Salinivirga cyanobacteriivorans]
MSLKQLFFTAILSLSFSILAFAQPGIEKSTSFGNSAKAEPERNYLKTKNIEFKYPVRSFDLINDTLMLIHYGRAVTDFTPVPKGGLVAINPFENKTYWKIKGRHVDATMYNGQAFINEKWLAYHVNTYTGKRDWYTDMNLFYWNDSLGVAYGAPFNRNRAKKTDGFRGVNIENGKTLWERPIDMFSTLDERLYLNDTSHLYSAKGLFNINPRDGKGWKYPIKTYKEIEVNQNNGAIVAAAASLVIGGLFGYMVLPAYSIPSKYITNVKSNILNVDNTIYFAGATKIGAISYKGKVLWETKLPVRKMAASVLLNYMDKILLVNKGIALYHGKPKLEGKPFIAVLDKNSGELQGFKDLDVSFVSDALLTEKLILAATRYMLFVDPDDLTPSAKELNLQGKTYAQQLVSGNYMPNIDTTEMIAATTSIMDIYFTGSDEKNYHYQVKEDSLNNIDYKLFVPIDTIKDRVVYYNRKIDYVTAELNGQILNTFSVKGTPYFDQHHLFVVEDKILKYVSEKKLFAN